MPLIPEVLEFADELTAIRRDAWGAASRQAVSPQAVRLIRPDGGAVEWSVDDEGNFTRKDSETHRWLVLAKGVTFQVDGPTLVLNWPAGHVNEPIRCVGQLQLAQGGERGAIVFIP